jgi:hypothetical protein
MKTRRGSTSRHTDFFKENEKKNWSRVPDGWPETRTNWPTEYRIRALATYVENKMYELSNDDVTVYLSRGNISMYTLTALT